jgi:hypothetical protein
VILPIAGWGRRKNRSGCPRSDVLEGGAPLVSPFFDHTPPRSSRVWHNMIEKFRVVEDDVDAAVPVDAQNAPTRTWKTATNAVFHSVHIDQCLLEKDENGAVLPMSSV